MCLGAILYYDTNIKLMVVEIKIMLVLSCVIPC
jgi:hypothetical protein